VTEPRHPFDQGPVTRERVAELIAMARRGRPAPEPAPRDVRRVITTTGGHGFAYQLGDRTIFEHTGPGEGHWTACSLDHYAALRPGRNPPAVDAIGQACIQHLERKPHRGTEQQLAGPDGWHGGGGEQVNGEWRTGPPPPPDDRKPLPTPNWAVVAQLALKQA